MKHKSVPATVGPGDAQDGVFEAIVSVFNNKDLVGDIVRPGAFTKSLAAWKSSGDPIPVYWNHRTEDPTYNIGEVIDARELSGGSPEIPDWANPHVKANGGLYVKAQLDDFGLGAHVKHLMQRRRVKQFSFAYDETVPATKSVDGNELTELWIHEIGPTAYGVNQLTELIGAKSELPVEAPHIKASHTATLLRQRCGIAVFRHEYAD